MQQQMLDAVARTSPDALLRSWMPMFQQTPEQMQQAMAAFFRGFSPGRSRPTPRPTEALDESGTATTTCCSHDDDERRDDCTEHYANLFIGCLPGYY